MDLQGKGFFIAQPFECEGGNPSAILLAAQAAGLSHVLVKIAEGTQASGLDPAGRDINVPLVQALHVAGIAVWGWHALSGDNPADEAALAVRRVHELALDGYVLCAGAAYEQPGREQAARAFMAEVRAKLSNVPLALSTYRFPNFHPGLPWATFLENCDAVMPQVYWEAAHNSGAQLIESLRQYRALPNARPCFPTGAVYGTPDGWAPTHEDMYDFLATAIELGVEAVNFFSWDACRNHLPQLWDLIAAFDWPAKKPEAVHHPHAQPPTATPSQEWDYPPAGGGQLVAPASQADAIKARVSSQPVGPDAFTTKYLNSLKSYQAAKVSALYAEDAIHVRGDKVLNGAQVIRSGYSAFFYGLPSGATFDLLGVEVRGDVRYLAWKAGPLTAYESIVLRDGVIILEYTYIE
jgi:hypothetical protein